MLTLIKQFVNSFCIVLCILCYIFLRFYQHAIKHSNPIQSRDLLHMFLITGEGSHHVWGKIFKNGPSKICERQPFKNFSWSILEYFAPHVIKITLNRYYTRSLITLETRVKITHHRRKEFVVYSTIHMEKIKLKY